MAVTMLIFVCGILLGIPCGMWQDSIFPGRSESSKKSTTMQREDVRTIAGPSPSQLDEQLPSLVAQSGHSGSVLSVAFSPDVRFLLTSAGDGALLWELATGKQIRRFEGKAIGGNPFSTDGRFVLTASQENIALICDVATGKVIHRLEGHTDRIWSAAFSPEGRFVLTGSGDKTARLWDAGSGEEIRQLAEHSGSITSVAYSPDGRYLFTASSDKSARMWNSDGNELQRFEGHTSGVTSVLCSSDGRLVLTGSDDQTARLWDPNNGNELRSFQGHRGHVYALALSPEASLVATGSWDGTARLWDASTGKEIRRCGSYSSSSVGVAFSPDGNVLLTGGENQQGGAAVHLCDLRAPPLAETKAEERQFSGLTWDVSLAVFAPDERFILTRAGPSAVWLWDTASGKVVSRFTGHTGWIKSVAVSSDGRFVLTGASTTATSSDQSARLWETTTGREIRRFEDTSGVQSVAFSPDARFVLTGSWEGIVRMWDASSGEEVRRFEGHTSHVDSVAFSPDGRFVVSGSADKSARLWETTTGREVHQFAGHDSPITSIAFSPDGHFVLTGSWDKTARLWDTATGREVRRLEGHTSSVAAVAFSPDGRFVLTGGETFLTNSDHTARLWDRSTGAEVRRFEGHSSGVTSVAFSPDGRFVLSAGRDDARLWETATGSEVYRLVAVRDGNWAVVEPEGRFDASSLEGAPWFHWIFSDDPFRPLSPEVFLRDYYEPGLMARLTAGEELPALPALADMNRVQPNIEQLVVEPTESADTVQVTVVASASSGRFQRGEQEITLETGVYDLRVFRDGQLVGQWPENAADAAIPANAHSEQRRQAWRDAARVCAPGQSVTKTFFIRLPRHRKGKELELSAYAFNRDRVKSPTVKTKYQIPKELPPVTRRAYLITVGVNQYQTPDWNLEFAAADARAVGREVGPLLRDMGFEVNRVTLISDSRAHDDEFPPTKANLKAVLNLLSKRPFDEVTRRQLSSQIGALRQATPDDLVLIFFSSHGYTSPQDGTYYLFPHDIGENNVQVDAELLSRCVSSDELSRWLREVDAGELVLIIDTCHAAATVEQAGFKAGPMGSRGLGQLAYDKGMRILAASQADDVAIESSAIKQGLLTYALVQDGLTQRRAAHQGRITLTGWLGYAERRVPELYDEVFNGEVRNARGEVARNVVPIRPSQRQARRIQRPSLFDFAGKRRSDLRLFGPAAARQSGSLTGYPSPVYSIAVTADRRYLLTGRRDAGALLWDLINQKPVFFETNSDWSSGAVAFSPDGRFVGTAGKDNTVRLWDAGAGHVTRRIQGHSAAVGAIAFSPDSRFVLTGSDDKTARLWNFSTGEQVRAFEGHTSAIKSIAFAPDGRSVLTGSWDKTARLWEASTGTEVRRFEGHDYSVNSVAFSPDGRFVLTGSSDMTARLWETASGNEIRRFEGRGQPSDYGDQVFSVTFSRDGRFVLTGGGLTAWLWETSSGTEVRRFAGHISLVHSVAFSPDGRSVLTASADKTARLWDATSGREIRRFEGGSNQLGIVDRSAVISPDGRLALIHTGTTSRVWELATGKEIRQFGLDPGEFESAALSPDGGRVLTGGRGGNIARIWDVATGRETFRLVGHSDRIRAVSFSSDGRFALTGSQDATARLWQTATGQEIRRFEGSVEPVTSVAFSPRDQFILTSQNRTARLWETTTGEDVGRFEGHAERITSVAFSPDGRFVLTGSEDSTARLWESDSAEEVRRFEGHGDQVTAVAFSPDGRIVLTGSRDNTARVWQTDTGKEILRCEGHTDWVNSVTFFPGGRFILTGSSDLTVRSWELDIEVEDSLGAN